MSSAHNLPEMAAMPHFIKIFGELGISEEKLMISSGKKSSDTVT